MDPRLLNYYNQELQFIRDTGAEFAAEFPKIASRLGLDSFDCADPYTERLLEGFALLAARVQLRLDAEFPRLTQHLLEMVCPHFLSPQPAMAVVQFQADLDEGGLASGFVVPRGTNLRSLLGKDDATPCSFRTSHDVTLWPLQLFQADYFPRDIAALDLPDRPGLRAALRLRLRTTAGLKFSQLSLDALPFFLRGGGDLPMRLYEQLFANTQSVLVRPVGSADWREVLSSDRVRRVGFEDQEAMLPYGPRSFQGYRLIQEYFAFPDRYMFCQLEGLGNAVRRTKSNELEIVFLLNQSDGMLENRVDASHFALFCSPAINLFLKRSDRIHLHHRAAEYHVVPDRTRPMDFEVYQVESVTGHGTSAEQELEFHPFYALDDHRVDRNERAYYTVVRQPRVLSQNQRKYGPRANYMGSETFVSLVDAYETPFHHDLRQLSVQTLCTNRDLPLQMPVGVGQTDFTLEESAPVRSVRCLSGPTRPRPSRTYEKGQTTWQLVSHLSLNYLSLIDESGRGGAALRELLMLYSDPHSVFIRKQIEGVRGVTSSGVTRPISTSGPLSFVRGLEITVTMDESAFEGSGVFLLGAVLEEFFARYVSLNSFTQTVLQTTERGEVTRWPPRIGRRQIL